MLCDVTEYLTSNGPNIAQSVGRHKVSPLPSEAGGKGDALNEGATWWWDICSALFTHMGHNET